MPLVCGPKNSRYTYTGTPCPHNDLAIEVTAETLRAAVAGYEAIFNCEITPAPDDHPAMRGHEGLYFLHTDCVRGIAQFVKILVVRGLERIEVMQNLDLTIRPDDIVEIVELAGATAA